MKYWIEIKLRTNVLVFGNVKSGENIFVLEYCFLEKLQLLLATANISISEANFAIRILLSTV